ncbi:MAG: thiamine phosphate synthase [bacterium]|nr:thiamine phosphate synthase [bacterium]
MTRPILCLVTDRSGFSSVAAAVRGGVDWVQLRDRSLEPRELLAALAEARAACGQTPVRWLVNRRVDLVWAAGADGVHLGFDGMAAEDARSLLGKQALIGIACHTPEEVCAADTDLSYVHLAPIHPPLSKPASRPPLGTTALERAAAAGVPILAQGGVTAANAHHCIQAGAAGVAVTGEILAAADPERAARALRAALDHDKGSE